MARATPPVEPKPKRPRKLEPPGRGRGRKAGEVFKPTAAMRKTVSRMAAAGIPQHEIARCLTTEGISRRTLVTHFRNELACAKPKAIEKLATSLYDRAVNGDTTAAIFWLKTRAGWVDQSKVEHTGPKGGPIQFEPPKRDLSKLSTEELLQLEQLTAKLEAPKD